MGTFGPRQTERLKEMIHPTVTHRDGPASSAGQGGDGMVESCGKHPHEMGVALCRRCGRSWCSTCLVYSFGPKKPPYCMSCAMYAGGVRSNAVLPAMPKRELRAHLRAQKAEAKAAAKAAKSEPAEQSEDAAAFAETDWSTPWWEDRQPTALAD
jgi:hypothetical protein